MNYIDMWFVFDSLEIISFPQYQKQRRKEQRNERENDCIADELRFVQSVQLLLLLLTNHNKIDFTTFCLIAN